MIKIALTTLLEAKEPSRELDCMLHEVITGQVDMQKETGCTPRSFERARGRMLLDLGSERLRIDVPKYTWHCEEACKLLPDQSYSMSYISPNFKLPIGISPPEFAYAAILRDNRLDVLRSEGSNVSMAFAVCKLALAYRIN